MERFDMEYTLRVLPPASSTDKKLPVTASDHKQAAFTLERRLKTLKLKKAKVTLKGSDLILVAMPGIAPGIAPKDAKRIRTILKKIAKLELKLVHSETRKLADKVAADPDNKIVPGYELKVLKDIDEDGNPTSENLLIKKQAFLNGSDIIHAQELYDPYEGQLDVELNDQGAEKMLRTTKQMNHGRDRLAIMLDDKVMSAPTVQSTLSKKFQISGLGTAKEAKALAAALLHPLKNPLVIEEERRVSSHLINDPSKLAAP